MDAKTAWGELEDETDGTPTAVDALAYLARNAEGWAKKFAHMAYLVAITKS